MFVPIDQYHGGWPECCIEPAGFLGGQWEFYLQLYFGSGVSPCYRGHRLYDPAQPAGRDLVKKYTAWNNQYRSILHADLIHLRRPNGNSVDVLLHVEPDTAKSQQRAMLLVFNQQVGRLCRLFLLWVLRPATCLFVARCYAFSSRQVPPVNHIHAAACGTFIAGIGHQRDSARATLLLWPGHSHKRFFPCLLYTSPSPRDRG